MLAGCKTTETAIAPSDLQIEIVRDKCITSLENASVEVHITNRSTSHLAANSEHFYLGGILDENNQQVMPFITTSDLMRTSPHWDELPKDSTISIRLQLIELHKYRLQPGRSYTLEVGYFRLESKGRNSIKNEMPNVKVRSRNIQVCAN